LTKCVRVANAGLKVAGFSVSCRVFARVAGKGVRERELTVDSLKSKGKERELNTETQRSETGTDLEVEVGLAASMGNGCMDVDYCQGISTIILSFERETGKWSGWKGLRGFCEFGETDYVPSVPVRPPFGPVETN